MIQVKITRAETSIDLTAAPYAVGTDFAPPSINPVYSIGTGTSANRLTGGTLIGKRLNDRQFAFTLRILAGSITEATIYQRRLSAYLEMTAISPTYLEYRQNAAIPVPLWGQFGSPLRYQIVTAEVSAPDERYAKTQGRGFYSTVMMEIRPLAEGTRFQLANASGGVFTNVIGSLTGIAHGMEIPEASINKFVNPVFGASTFSTSWTAGAGVVGEVNLDPAFCFPGFYQSAKLTPIAAANRQYYATLTLAAVTYTISFLICKPDRSTISALDVSAWFAAASQTATLESLGNGWYRGYYTATASALATTYGIVVNTPMYVALMQLEAKAYPTPFFFGEMLGCVWDGSTNNSSSTRSLGQVKVSTAGAMYRGAGSFNLIWRAGFNASSGIITTNSLVYMDAGTMKLQYDTVNDRFVFTDGTNAANGTTETFARGDVIYLTATWGPGGLALYKNGVSLATNATYTPPTWNTTVNVGGDVSLASTGEYYAFETYDHVLTQAEITAWYTAVAAIVGAGDRPDNIPCLWTKDTDGEVDNANDSARDNWACAIDIPGSAAADVIYKLDLGASATSTNYLFISRFDSASFINPAYFYADLSGTADANSSGGAYEHLLMSATDTVSYSANFTGPRIVQEIYEREILPIARIRHDSGSTHSFTPYSGFGSYVNGKTTYPTLDTTNFTLQRASTMVFHREFYAVHDLGLIRPLTAGTLGLAIVALTGANKYLDTDFVDFLFRPLIKIDGTFNSVDGIVVHGVSAYAYDTGEVVGSSAIATGDEITLIPNRYNNLVSHRGYETNEMLIAMTFTYSAVMVTPRYTLV